MPVSPLFDRQLYCTRRQRFADMVDSYNYLHLEIERDLIYGLESVTRPFSKVWLYGDLRLFKPNVTYEHFDVVSRSGVLYLDEEDLPLAVEPIYDLIISHLSMQFINDLPGLLMRYRRMLQPKGLFLATMFGEETLHELRSSMAITDAQLLGGAAPRVVPFVDVRSAGALLQRAGFSMPVASTQRYMVEYSHLHKLLYDLRYMGQGSCMHLRDRSCLPRHYFAVLEETYHKNYSSEGLLRCTYDVLTLSGSAD